MESTTQKAETLIEENQGLSRKLNANASESQIKGERERFESVEFIEERVDEHIRKEIQGFWRRVYESKTSMCKHKRGCVYNVLQGVLKSAALGYGIKYAINVLFSLMKPKKFYANVFSAKAFVDSSRFALFMILFNIVYKAALCTLRRFTKNDKLSSIIAGVMCALSLFMEKSSRREFLALIFFSRMLDSFMNLMETQTNGYVRKFKYGETIFLLIQCIFLKYLYAYEWELVPKSVAAIYKAYSLQKPNDLAVKKLIWRPVLDDFLKAHPHSL